MTGPDHTWLEVKGFPRGFLARGGGEREREEESVIGIMGGEGGLWSQDRGGGGVG